MGTTFIEHRRDDYAEDHFITAYNAVVSDDGIIFYLLLF